MLEPRETPTRERRSLDGLWRFALDAEGVGRADGWWRHPLPGAREAPVPASYNDLFADARVHDHVGDVWYQTVARVPARWAGERVVLRFGSATHRAVVWVNDTQVVAHEGGYTPFAADVTDVVEFGADNRVTAVVNNVLTWQSIPPGYVEPTPEGPRQFYFHDFFNYAGIHRTVWLYTTPTAYVRDVTVVTGLSGTVGTVGYEVETAGAEGTEVRVALTDATGTDVALATGAAGELTVADVHPWRPGEGYLYTFTVELWRDGEGPVDVYPLPVGIRTVEVSGTRFLINGEPFYFRGFGKHEDTPVRGKGHDDVFLVHDFALLDWIGANSFRTSHYPYAEEVLDHADRHGIVVIDETAAVGLNAQLGATLAKTSFTTFSPDTARRVPRRSQDPARGRDHHDQARRRGAHRRLRRLGDPRHPRLPDHREGAARDGRRTGAPPRRRCAAGSGRYRDVGEAGHPAPKMTGTGGRPGAGTGAAGVQAPTGSRRRTRGTTSRAYSSHSSR